MKVACLLAAISTTAATAWSSPAFAGGGVPRAQNLDIRSCHSATIVLAGHIIDRSHAFDDSQVTIDGWTVPFGVDRWHAQNPTNPLLTMIFHSGAWVIPEEQADLPAAVDLFVQQSVASPDPGSGVGRGGLLALGWTEAAVTLRMGTALCLYLASGESGRARMLTAIDALISANLDPARYYGPPVNRAHNHGLMADRALLDMAVALGRPSLAAIAHERLQRQLAALYDSCTMNREQSSAYQYVHAGLWSQLVRRVTDDTLLSLMSTAVSRLRATAGKITYPDGTMPRIGDGTHTLDPSRAGGRVRDVSLMCPDTGWYAWRRSSGRLTQHVVARFGPPTMLHGHEDKGEVTWWVGSGAAGEQVLADRGLPGKNRDSRYAYAVGPEGHPTLLWAGGSSGGSSATSKHGKATSILTITAHRRPEIGTWTRRVQMSAARSALVIRDSVAGPASTQPGVQNFPLDPTWVPLGQEGLFVSQRGSKLTIECSTFDGRHVRVLRHRVIDYEDSSPRTAHTATCATGRMADGLTATLRVTPVVG